MSDELVEVEILDEVDAQEAFVVAGLSFVALYVVLTTDVDPGNKRLPMWEVDIMV